MGGKIGKFWSSVRGVLTARYKYEEDKKVLQSGQACLLFRGSEADAARDREIVFVDHCMVHIPYHSGSPWRPTFAVLRILESDVPKALSLRPGEGLREEDAYIRFELERTADNLEPHFRTPHQLSAGMNMDLRWQVCFLQLSQRPLLFPHSWGLAKAKFEAEGALPVWRGKLLEGGGADMFNDEDFLEPLDEVADAGLASDNEAREEEELLDDLRQAGRHILGGSSSDSDSSDSSTTSSSSSSSTKQQQEQLSDKQHRRISIFSPQGTSDRSAG